MRGPNKKNNNREQGYIVLLSVIILSVIAGTISISLLMLGLSHSQSSFVLGQSVQAEMAANACGEFALESLRQDSSYPGNERLSFSTGSCIIKQVTFNDPVYSIQAQGISANITRNLSIQAERPTSTPARMHINLWQEVADF